MKSTQSILKHKNNYSIKSKRPPVLQRLDGRRQRMSSGSQVAAASFAVVNPLDTWTTLPSLPIDTEFRYLAVDDTRVFETSAIKN